MKNLKVLIFISCLVVLYCGQALGNDCTSFSNRLDSVYGFKPSKLTSAEKTAKSAKLDEVWKAVRDDVKTLKPCLLLEIDKRKDDGFFRFNASNLLFDLEQSDDVKRIMIGTHAGVDLNDINPRYWVPYMTRFGFEGFDTSSAAENWLKYPAIQYYLPQHGTLPMTSFKGALCLYGSMDEKYALASSVKLTASTDPIQKFSGYFFLTELATDEADTFLREVEKKGLPPEVASMVTMYLKSPRSIEPRLGQPKTSKSEFLVALNQLASGNPMKFIELTSAVSDGEKDMVRVLTKEDIPLLRKVRRYYSSLATPHSTQWHKTFTDIINTIRMDLNSIK
ncbi:MAG TPA: hypothetical protein PKA82_14460 [Pyrinomonadaceae bacterium]|nr:hypothetical protein [Pyrinomonadaceae bacterium]